MGVADTSLQLQPRRRRARHARTTPLELFARWRYRNLLRHPVSVFLITLLGGSLIGKMVVALGGV